MIFGSEHELVVSERPPARDLWLPASVVPPGRARPSVLERLLGLAADAFGTKVTFPKRVHISSGAVLYVDGDSLEYATPPCSSPEEIAMHECDLDPIVRFLASSYEATFGDEIVINWAGEGPEGARSGYHENYGLPRHEYFQLFHPNYFPREIWDRVLVPFLVTRILVTGGGGQTPEGFEVSPRAALTTHVYHGSSDPQRPLVHLKRPNPRTRHPRIQLTCADPTRLVPSTVVRFISMAVTLGVAARDGFGSLDLSLRDPVSSIRQLSREPSSELELEDGRWMPAVEIFATISEQAIAAAGTGRHGVDRQVLAAWLRK